MTTIIETKDNRAAWFRAHDTPEELTGMDLTKPSQAVDFLGRALAIQLNGYVPDTVIELCCGTGRNIRSILGIVDTYVGVDFIPTAVGQAQEMASERSTIHLADVTYPWGWFTGFEKPVIFDANASCCLQGEEFKQMLEQTRVLSPGTPYVYFNSFAPSLLDGASGGYFRHEKFKRVDTRELLEAAFKEAGFALLWFNFEPETVGGQGIQHQNVYALFEKLG